MVHILLLPLTWFVHVGGWVNNNVLAPFQIGTTAKQVTEEELGVFGVLAYLIFKTSRLIVDAWPLASGWLAGRIVHGVALVATLVLSAWLLMCTYIGLLIPILDLSISYGGLLLSPLIAWLALGYVLLAERVRARRAELAAQSGEEEH